MVDTSTRSRFIMRRVIRLCAKTLSTLHTTPVTNQTLFSIMYLCNGLLPSEWKFVPPKEVRELMRHSQ